LSNESSRKDIRKIKEIPLLTSMGEAVMIIAAKVTAFNIYSGNINIEF
jgi:hypothetical protein